MEASEDNSETDEVEIRFEESVLSESGFEELACKYNVYSYYFFETKRTARSVYVCVYIYILLRKVKEHRLVFVRGIIIMVAV